MVTYVKISDLPVATEATGNSELEVNQAGVTRKITVDQIADAIAEILPPPDMSDYATDEEVADAIAAIPDPAWSEITGKPNFDTLYVNVAGDTMTGALSGTSVTMSGNIITTGGDMRVDRATGQGSMEIRTAAGQTAVLYFKTGALNRWALFKNTTAEGGANAGSNFQLNAYDDAGTTIGTAWNVTRSTLATALGGALTGTTATMSGNIITNGGVVSVDRAGDAAAAEIYVGSDAGQAAGVNLRTGAVNRWILRKTSTAEGGSNAGSDFEISPRNDAGGALPTAVTITRSTGAVTLTGALTGTTAAFSGAVTSVTAAPGTNTTQLASTAFVTAALAGGGASISVGVTPPVSPAANALWWNSDAVIGGGQMFIFYDGFWVPASPGVGSGAVVQTVSYQTGAMATGTTLMINDDTIPQISEGTEFMTCAITPKSATSRLVIEVLYAASVPSNNNIVLALFQDSTANALAAVVEYLPASAHTMLSLRHTMVSGTTSAMTFRVRAGPTGALTLTFNGYAGARFMGGVMASSIVIQEVL